MTDDRLTAGQLRPMDLRRTARAIASNYGDRGAIVLTVSDEGVRIGTEGLTAAEQREALAVAMHYTFVFESHSSPDKGVEGATGLTATQAADSSAPTLSSAAEPQCVMKRTDLDVLSIVRCGKCDRLVDRDTDKCHMRSENFSPSTTGEEGLKPCPDRWHDDFPFTSLRCPTCAATAAPSSPAAGVNEKAREWRGLRIVEGSLLWNEIQRCESDIATLTEGLRKANEKITGYRVSEDRLTRERDQYKEAWDIYCTLRLMLKSNQTIKAVEALQARCKAMEANERRLGKLVGFYQKAAHEALRVLTPYEHADGLGIGMSRTTASEFYDEEKRFLATLPPAPAEEEKR